MEKINWYVGHMAKSFNSMEKQLNQVDLVIQILDARCPNISSNNELVKLCKHKPIINIALKSDLADLSSKQQNINYLSISQKKFVTIVEKIIQDKLADKIKKYKTKGLVNPHFYIMVVGLPNIGKSSFINAFAKRNKTVVQNRPGITRNINLIKVNKYFSIYDTPGILIKNIANETVAFILGLIGSIDKKVLPIEKLVRFAYDFYTLKYPKEFNNYFEIKKSLLFEQFLNYVANKYKLIGKQNLFDYQKVYEFLFNIFLNNKICKINYE